MLTLSIVIPVYNEENHLKACLDSIASQTIKPLEVIVVDNNSTDKSVAIAKKYRFVKTMHEKRQGQVFAQAKGFNHAKGKILGRIDADSILAKDWVEKVTEYFGLHPETVGVTGSPVPYDIKLKKIAQAVFHFYHFTVNYLLHRRVMLWGANCALRSESWRKVKRRVTYRRDIWEDYDLSFLILELGRIDHMKDLIVGCSFRAVDKPFRAQLEYHMRQVRTHNIHTNKHGIFLLFIVFTKIIFIYPLTVLDIRILRKFER